jgi:hypothetical protein
MGQGDVTAVQGLLDAARRRTPTPPWTSTPGWTWSRVAARASPVWSRGRTATTTPSATPRSRGAAAAGPWSSSSTPTTGCPATPSAWTWSKGRAGVIASEGGGHVHMWVNQPRPEHDRIAAEVGLAPAGCSTRCAAPPGRGLLRTERSRLDDPTVPRRRRRGRLVGGQQPGLSLAPRTRAAGTGPRWKQREAEPWFDPAGFLLHDDADGPPRRVLLDEDPPDTDPPLGEIYVIAVDPAGATDPRPGPANW